MMKWWISNCLFEEEMCKEDGYEMVAETLPKTLWMAFCPLTAVPICTFLMIQQGTFNTMLIL